MADLPITAGIQGLVVTLSDMFVCLFSRAMVGGRKLDTNFLFFFSLVGKKLESTTLNGCPKFGRGGSSVTSHKSRGSLAHQTGPIKKARGHHYFGLRGIALNSLHQRFEGIFSLSPIVYRESLGNVSQSTREFTHSTFSLVYV